MIKDLYTFSKNAWHVKLFKWIYGIDPTQRFKNFCPMFWSYILTFIFLPILLISKLGGESGKKFVKWIHDYRKNTKQKFIDLFIQKCSKIIDPEEAYNVYKSKEWDKYNYYLDYDTMDKIRSLARKSTRFTYSWGKQTKFQKFWDKYGDYIGFGLIAILILALLFALGKVLFKNIDWKLFWEFIGGLVFYIIYFIGFWTVGGWIGEYIVKSPKIKKFFGNGFTKLINGIKNIFSKIRHGFEIFIDMIINIYKKNCPIVNWEDQNNEKSN